MTNDLTLLLINGAWHRASMWDRVRAQLPEVRTIALQLPSSAPVPKGELGDLFADAAAIRSAVDAIGGPVVICAHSYGGAPTSQALVGATSVQRIVYLNAFVLDIGESMLSIAGGTYKPHWDVHEDDGYVDVIDAEDVLYNDLPPAEAHAAAAALGSQSLASLTEQLTQAAWRDHDTTYIVGEADAGIPPQLSLKFASRTNRVVTIDASHSAFLSKPRELAELLRDEIRQAQTNRAHSE